MLRPALALVLSACAASAAAAPPALNYPQGTVETYSAIADPGAAEVPIARFTPTAQPVLRLEGRITRRVLRVPADRGDTLALVQALREQLGAAGFEILLDCATEDCGGFDFRAGIAVLPPPEMEFSLADFRHLSARAPETEAHAALLISRTPRGTFVQATFVEPGTAPLDGLAPVEETAEPLAGTLAAMLDRDGHAVLEGISFASGSAALEPGGEAILAELAALLDARPELSLVIVGHTDTDGSLEGNIAISRDRARTVADILSGTYAIAPERLDAQGAGYLAPRASNATEEGRTLNRRVEVVVR